MVCSSVVFVNEAEMQCNAAKCSPADKEIVIAVRLVDGLDSEEQLAGALSRNRAGEGSVAQTGYNRGNPRL